MKKKIYDTVSSIIISGIQSFLTVFIIEWIYRGSVRSTCFWIRDDAKPFIYNCLLLLLMFSGFHLLKRKGYIIVSFVASIPLLILSLASYIKQSIREMPVVPSDLSMTNEATSMSQLFSGTLLFWAIAGLVVSCGIIVLLAIKVPNQAERNWIRISTSAILMLLFFVTFSIESKADSTYLKSKFNITDIPWDQKGTYEQDGVIAGFTLNMKWMTQPKPKGYTKAAIENIINQSVQSKVNNTEKPNIIVIMNEAFWDPTRMTNVQFNKDPLPYFHQLQQKQTSGNLNVSVFGGSTANTEFEALTGLTTQLLPAGSIAYLNYVNKPIPSLPYILREQGYDTTAIHTWHSWFYNRSAVYKYLGFDRFISAEYMVNPVPHGAFIHDQTMTDQIIEKLTTNNNGKPNFIFGVTTLNHGPYNPNLKYPYANMEVNLKDGAFTKEAKGILEVYSDNLTEIDKELKRLIAAINATHKKTILVFFGDHLPLLGNNFDVYRETGYYQENNTYDEYLKMHSTPLLIWDNFSQKKENLNIGSSLLSPIILNRAGLNGNYVTDFLYSEYKNGFLTRVPSENFWNTEKFGDNTLNNLKMLQYDILFGKMYGIEGQNLKPSSSYRLGYHDPEIKGIKMGIDNGKKVLIVSGKYLTSQSFVYINDKKMDKLSGNGSEIIIPLINLKHGAQICIKTIDSNEKVLSKSNQYTYY